MGNGHMGPPLLINIIPGTTENNTFRYWRAVKLFETQYLLGCNLDLHFSFIFWYNLPVNLQTETKVLRIHQSFVEYEPQTIEYEVSIISIHINQILNFFLKFTVKYLQKREVQKSPLLVSLASSF